MISSQAPVLIPITFLFAAMLVPLVGSVHRAAAHLTAVLGSALALYFSVIGMQATLAQGRISYHIAGWMPPIGIEFVLDPLSAFVCTLLCGVTFIVMVFGKRSVEYEIPQKEIAFYSLSMLLLGGLAGMVMTGDLFNLYVFLEIGALAGYALVAIGDKRAVVSAFRYLVMGTVGATFYLLGVALIFISTGTLNMADIAELMPLVQDSPAVIVGLVLIVLGTALKMALFPMHAWLPDAYTHASTTATALIAPIGTKVSAYVLLRVLFFVVDPDYLRNELDILAIIGYLGAIGIIWGSIMAICQSELKRMLAYSSVAQVGYIAVGIALASPLGFIGAILHALNHAVMKCCLFLVSGNMRLRLGHSSIPQMTNGLRKSMPWTSAAFTLAAISMIGLPPTAGFFGKWYLALGAIEQSHWIFLTALLISTILNVAYFFRVMERMYLKPQETGGVDYSEQTIARNEAPASMLIPTLFLAISLLVLGFANAWIVTNLIVPMIPGWL
ncbi:complex I subunit 5 family protein [Desulfonatronum lacustre]|uniref:complex I subunit 5 family protein n=1 Tax=Desulfonatronum lacustre TaxID=66849 RepID=UPI0004904918|nr:proton-conducting transporter membrane subunit [Desulfonatronum lacustre]